MIHVKSVRIQIPMGEGDMPQHRDWLTANAGEFLIDWDYNYAEQQFWHASVDSNTSLTYIVDFHFNDLDIATQFQLIFG